MARAPFVLFHRKASPSFYVQLWNQKTSKYSSALSTHTSSRSKAVAYAKKLCEAQALGFGKQHLGSLVEYGKDFWLFETSPYIQSQLSRRENGIGRTHCHTSLRYIERFVGKYFGLLKLSEISPQHLQGYLLWLQKIQLLSPRSVNAAYDAIALPIREAFRMQLIPTDPTQPIRKVWVPKTEKGILTSEEIRAIFSIPWRSTIARTATLISALCGLRLGEICALQKEMVSSNRLQVRYSYSRLDGLKCPKNGRTRTVPLPEFLKSELDIFICADPITPWLFPGKTQIKPIDSGVITRGFKEALRSIGISEEVRKKRKLSFHSMRHFCNAMLRGAVPDEKLRLLTGHSSEELTCRYDHLTEFDHAMLLKAQADRLIPLVSQPA